jgi:hypothetical protein
MNPRLLLFATVGLLVTCHAVVAQNKTCPALEANVLDSKFKPGQVWSYRNRLGESDSTFTILQIDRGEKTGIIIHIRVDGLKAHNPKGELVPSVEHMPFTRDAILLSAVSLVRTDNSAPNLEGYETWHSNCGGVYTISIAKAVDIMEKTLNSHATPRQASQAPPPASGGTAARSPDRAAPQSQTESASRTTRTSSR